MAADRVDVYEDKRGEWRWRRRARNNKTVSESGEGYSRENDALTAAARTNPGTPVFGRCRGTVKSGERCKQPVQRTGTKRLYCPAHKPVES